MSFPGLPSQAARVNFLILKNNRNICCWVDSKLYKGLFASPFAKNYSCKDQKLFSVLMSCWKQENFTALKNYTLLFALLIWSTIWSDLQSDLFFMALSYFFLNPFKKPIPFFHHISCSCWIIAVTDFHSVFFAGLTIVQLFNIW